MAQDTILLSPELPGVRREAKADAAIKPGNLVEITATGVAVQSAAAATGGVLKAFATENISVAGSINNSYDAGENTFFCLAQSGAYIKATMSAATYAVGDELETAGDGTLKAKTTGDTIAIVDEAGTPAANGHLRVTLV